MNEVDPYPCISDLAPRLQDLTAIRRHIHAHPELSHEEVATSDLVASKLEDWGYQVTRHIGGHGVVGVLRCGVGQRSIGIRADMDALPIHEQTGLPYASKHAGKMHACGHDGHTTMLLGAAEYLAQTRRFSGTLNLIFQPAEESGTRSGAATMIADRLFERFPCDAVFGLHNHPGLAMGKFLFRPGPMMAAVDTVFITIHGKGGHASRPHLSIDPVVVASSIVMSLQTVIARNVNPAETAVITVGSIHAGDAPNVIPESAKLSLSVRSFTSDIGNLLKARIHKLVESLANAYGATVDIEYIHGAPVVINSDVETAFARKVAEELVGPENVDTCPLLTGSEDFAYLLQQRPGCFLRLGNSLNSLMLHNPAYDFIDESLPIGAAFWSRLVERYFSTNEN